MYHVGRDVKPGDQTKFYATILAISELAVSSTMNRASELPPLELEPRSIRYVYLIHGLN